VLTSVSTNIAVAIFKVGMRWDEFWRPYIWQAVSGEINLMMLIGGVGCYPMGEEHMWLRKGGSGIFSGGDEGGLVNMLDGKGFAAITWKGVAAVPSTMRFREVMVDHPFLGPGKVSGFGENR
jgi:hypothetical protein